MTNLRNNNQSGFTLIELLVVIAIIGLFSSIVLVSLQGAKNKAIDSKVTQEISQVKTVLEAYNAEHGGYPYPDSGNPTDNAYCIGKGCNLLAHPFSDPTYNINTYFQNDSWSFNFNKNEPKNVFQLASLFPAFNYGGGIGGNIGYIYVRCTRYTLVNNLKVCPPDLSADEAPAILYTKTDGMKEMIVGSYTEFAPLYTNVNSLIGGPSMLPV